MGIKPNSNIVVNVLSTCAYLLALDQGKSIYGYAMQIGFACNIIVGNCNVEM